MSAPVPKVRTLECPTCGGTVELRGHAHTISAVCAQCLSVIDTSDPNLRILQQFDEKQRILPRIPLGTRGKLQRSEWEVIGFQVRQIVVEGVEYRWSEYLLYNPYKGYRYLTEYQGHWNVVRTLAALPDTSTKRGRRAMRFAQQTYSHFQSAKAETVYVLGEFPWRVQVGEVISVEDFVSAPYSLSAEITDDEVVWSTGTYVPGEEIWKAFSLQGHAPPRQGIYSNQPSPYTGKVKGLWVTLAWLMLLFIILGCGVGLLGRGSQVFAGRYAYSSSVKTEPAFVTSIFNVSDGNVRVDIDTDLSNDWAFFSLALINDDTGHAYDFGREVSYYFGRDSDGSWTEGRRTATYTVPGVPSGRYYLRVEPEMDDDGRVHAVNYGLTVSAGALDGTWLLVVFFLLPIPAIWKTWRSVQFESKRWAESDYGSMFGTSSGDD
jgi:hypothetical protein